MFNSSKKTENQQTAPYTVADLSEADRKLPAWSQQKIVNAKNGWHNASLSGDQNKMNYYQTVAENERYRYGRSGGSDGNQDILLKNDYNGFSSRYAPIYYDVYDNAILENMEQIQNQKPFSYQPEEDPLYQSYRRQYNREGQQAMQNTLGEVSARTGGLASSYAGTAATQANQYYAQQLADKIPELRQLAYSMYLENLNQKRQNLSLLQSLSERDYDRYRNDYSDWYNERSFAADQYWKDKNAEDQKENEQRSHQQWQQTFDYEKERNDVADRKWQQENAAEKATLLLQAGVVPSAALLEAAGISESDAKALAAEIQRNGLQIYP